MKIAVAGVGYVGLSLAVLLAQNNEVWTLNNHQSKADLINKKKSPIKDAEIEDYLQHKKLNLHASTNYREVFDGAKFIIIATPTNYDDEKKYFDTSSVDLTIERALEVCGKNTTIIIKSTVPVGYTKAVRKKYNVDNIIFSPEFLREGKALYDNLYPSRIIIGSNNDSAHEFAELLTQGSEKKDAPICFMDSTEAEAVKLFANTYLAMRVAFFNELDTYAEIKGLNTKDIINGICMDPRIGLNYNNPSFGYGGYCLPKNTKQLLANFDEVPQTLISAVVAANQIRKQHIANMIINKNPKVVGIYRLTMKSGSDNFRSSAILDIIKILNKKMSRL